MAARTQMEPLSTVEVTARKFSWMENLVHVDGRLIVANLVFFSDPYCVVQVDCRHLVDNMMVLESCRVVVVSGGEVLEGDMQPEYSKFWNPHVIY